MLVYTKSHPLPDNGESSSSYGQYEAKVSKQWSSLIKVYGNSLPASQSGWEDVEADRCHKPAILSYQKHFLIFQFPHSLSHFPLLLSFPMLVLGQLPQEELVIWKHTNFNQDTGLTVRIRMQYAYYI